MISQYFTRTEFCLFFPSHSNDKMAGASRYSQTERWLIRQPRIGLCKPFRIPIDDNCAARGEVPDPRVEAKDPAHAPLNLRWRKMIAGGLRSL
jgi:hypothetical protein